jgi:tetratricopeptide (TPR) repeat protein
MRWQSTVTAVLGIAMATAMLPAQGGGPQSNGGQGSGGQGSGGTPPVRVEADAAKKAPPKPKASEAARTAVAAARETESKIRGADGPARAAALQTAAAAWDKLAADFATEPAVAAAAAFRGGELWQRHGSFAQAEQDFLASARLEPQQFGQRGLLEAADMQRRQKRNDEALTSYGQVIAADAGSPRAQEARIWQGRLLQALGRIDESIGAFRKALDAAGKPKQVVEAANYLAKALIAKGDLDNAENALAHADEAIHKAIAADAAQAERLQRTLDSMSARKALQRARDKQTGAGKDARVLEEHRAGRGGG